MIQDRCNQQSMWTMADCRANDLVLQQINFKETEENRKRQRNRENI